MIDDRAEILARVDLQALWPELVGPKSRGGWPCPNPDHAQTGATPPVSIKPAAGADPDLWKCHGCDAGGTAVDLVILATGVDVAAAFTDLRERAGLRPPPAPTVVVRRQRTAGPEADQAGAAAALQSFLTARGWSEEIAEAHGITALLDDHGRWRARFPFRANGETVWHQDRLISGMGPKFLAPSGSRSVLYARDLTASLTAAHRIGCAVLVEGPPDVVALAHAFTSPAVFGVPGVQMPPARWAPALAGLRVALIADNDDAGTKFRCAASKALFDAGSTVDQVLVPAGHSDVDDWRRSTPTIEAFAAAVDAAFDHAALPKVPA